MPGAANNNGFDARRFASLMTSFDLGNPNEAEAMNAARALRRMVEAAGARFVDVMERADVKQALDDQMQPVRQASPELQQARQEAAALRQELTERTRDVRELAELLRQERARAGKQATKPAPALAPGFGPMNGGLIVAVVLMVALLLVGSLGHRESLKERTTQHAMGSNQGEGAGALPKGLGLLHIPNSRRLSHRVRRGGASGDVQPVRKLPRSLDEQVARALKEMKSYERKNEH